MQDQNCPYKETRTTAVHATEVQHLRVNKGAADLSIVDVGVFKFQVQVQRALEMCQWGRVQVGPIECAG